MKLTSKIDRRLSEMLKLIEENVEYSNKIVNDLLDFSREIHLQRTRVGIKSMIEETLPKIKIPKKVEVIDQTGELPKVFVDADRIKRVFENLVKNAVEAMPKGGKLEIKSQRVTEGLQITFQDNGMGISSQNQQKLFTPMFTTKAKGVGLGLAICKRIIDAHGGVINIKSKEGIGALVTVIIPIMKEK